MLHGIITCIVFNKTHNFMCQDFEPTVTAITCTDECTDAAEELEALAEYDNDALFVDSWSTLEDTVNSFICSICGTVFDQKLSLWRHQVAHHS